MMFANVPERPEIAISICLKTPYSVKDLMRRAGFHYRGGYNICWGTESDFYPLAVKMEFLKRFTPTHTNPVDDLKTLQKAIENLYESLLRFCDIAGIDNEYVHPAPGWTSFELWHIAENVAQYFGTSHYAFDRDNYYKGLEYDDVCDIALFRFEHEIAEMTPEITAAIADADAKCDEIKQFLKVRPHITAVPA